MEDCKHQYYWALRIIRPRPCRNQPPPQQQGLSTRSLWSESRVVPEQNSTDTTAAMTAATTTMAPTPTLTPTHYNSSTANPVVDVLQSSVARTELTVTGYLMISAFLVVLALCLMVIVGSLWHRYKNNNPPIVSSSSGRQRRRRQRQWLWRLQPNDNDTNNNNTESEQQQQQHQRHQQYQAHQKQRIQRRYETIEHWIISKRVQTHNAFCAGVVANFNHHHHHPDTNTNHPCETEEKEEDVERAWPDAPRNDVPQLQEEENAEHHYKNDDEEEDTPECPICMLELLPGEIVSWSANEQCCHVYHHECIKEWLLRRTECCLCKHIFLPVDTASGKQKGTKANAKSSAALNEWSLQFAAAAATSYYCACNGLVRIPKTVRCTRPELGQLEQRIFDGVVPPSKLVALRGSNPPLVL